MSLDPKENRRGKSRHEVGVGCYGVTTGSGEQHSSLRGLELNAVQPPLLGC